MTDHDALVRAICANPDDDTPRLVYADYLDENGEPERAAFVRAQVELARTPPWEPFAVYCRHRKLEWSEKGRPFRSTLPDLGPAGSWHESAFRRGLGWHVWIASHFAWEETAPRLFEEVPIGEVHFPIGLTLDDWRRFTTADWVRYLRIVHLEASSPVEPVRSLCESRNATGITDLAFHAAVSPGLPFVVSDLLRSRLGEGLRGLYFRLGDYAAVPDLLDAIGEDGTGLERLTLSQMSLTPDLLERWCDRGGPVGLQTLDLDNNVGLGEAGATILAAGLQVSGDLVSLGLANCAIGDRGIENLATCEGLKSLRLLDISGNRLALSRAPLALAESRVFSGVRMLKLRQCGLWDSAVNRLTKAYFWPNLVELDLRDNPFDDDSVRYFRNAPVPPDLTAILLSKRSVGRRAIASLREHFGDRLILDDGDE